MSSDLYFRTLDNDDVDGARTYSVTFSLIGVTFDDGATTRSITI